LSLLQDKIWRQASQDFLTNCTCSCPARYSLHTEDAYADWSRQFILFHVHQPEEGEILSDNFWKERAYVFGDEFRHYIENDVMKREPHLDAKPLSAFPIGQPAK